jgi:hypothetical protein
MSENFNKVHEYIVSMLSPNDLGITQVLIKLPNSWEIETKPLKSVQDTEVGIERTTEQFSEDLENQMYLTSVQGISSPESFETIFKEVLEIVTYNTELEKKKELTEAIGKSLVEFMANNSLEICNEFAKSYGDLLTTYTA